MLFILCNNIPQFHSNVISDNNMQFIHIEVHIENCQKKKNILHLATSTSSLVFTSGNLGFPKIVKAIFSTSM